MNRVAVITGASRGIGAATALTLAERGFRVVVNHRASAPQAAEVVAAISAVGGEAVAIRADVTSPEDVAAMFDETERRWGQVDVLVHNALIPFDVTSFAELTWEQLGGKLDHELHAAFLITKAVAPGMISRGYGRLVYLSTGLSRRPREGMIALGTAKAALDQFVRYLALDLAPHGITANLVAPATVDETKVTEQLTSEQLSQLGATNPMGRLVRPEEVARTISKYNLLAVPVVDDGFRVLGIVTVDDVIDALVREQTEDVQKFGGMEALDEPYTQIGFFSMIKKRAGWLCASRAEGCDALKRCNAGAKTEAPAKR